MNSSLVVGEFDVSGLTIDPRTGKVGGNWIEVIQGASKSLDHQTVAELCRCCGTELLRSGSKWSVWFCKECKSRVDSLNRSAGACVVPIGRHTLMHGVGVRGGDALRDPALVTAFLAAANDVVRKQNRVSEWAAEIVTRNCVSCALTGDEPIPMSTYLEAVAFQSRKAAFDAMCEWWKISGRADATKPSAESGASRIPNGSPDGTPTVPVRARPPLSPSGVIHSIRARARRSSAENRSRPVSLSDFLGECVTWVFIILNIPAMIVYFPIWWLIQKASVSLRRNR